MARLGGDDEEEAPWLAAAEPDARETYVTRRRFRLVAILLGVLLLVVAALVYAVVARPHQSDDELGFAGDVPLIRAPDGPFRTRPSDAGGMAVEGLNQTTYEAAGGVDPQGELALDQIPEEPMARPVAPKVAVPAPRPTVAQPSMPAPVHIQPQVVLPPQPSRPAEPTRPLVPHAPPFVVSPSNHETAPTADRPRPSTGSGRTETKGADTKVVTTPSKDRLADVLADVDKAATKASKPLPEVTSGGSGPASLQLGAFSSSAKAEAAWKNFQRYGYLAGLAKSVIKVDREEGGAVYRLRATGVESRDKASNLCARLKVAGEQCVVSE